MRVIVDVFGGDNAPAAILQGASDAVREFGVEITLCGDIEAVKKAAAEAQVDLSPFELEGAESSIPVEEDPTAILKRYKNCSMATGLRLLREGVGDAFVTAGSTGACVVGASTLVGRIRGIKRAAIAPVMPSDTGRFLLIDGGANAECRPEMLVQFGLMGSAFMERVLGVTSPRVGLANIGAEETKGTELQQEAYRLLTAAPLNFRGNAEGRDIPAGDFDVIVADGFTGNIILKLTEGVAITFNNNLKRIFGKNLLTKLAAMMVMGGLKAFKKKMDYKEIGGAPLLGLQKPVIKAHGSSDRRSFKNAILQAKTFYETGVIAAIADSLAKLPEASGPEAAPAEA